jgi:hypothetical protein
MGLFDWLTGGTADVVKGTLEGAGTFARDVRSAITGEIDPEKQAELIAKAEELEHASRESQMEVNRAEANHASIFVAGWRPFIGWTGGLALFYQFLLRPIANGFGMDFPTIETEALYPIILGMLGLGGLRTYEKARGVQNKH